MIHIHRTRTRAKIDSGERKEAYCFACRQRQSFAFIIVYPDSTYYGPHGEWVCLSCRRAATHRFGASKWGNPPVTFQPPGTPVPPLSDLA